MSEPKVLVNEGAATKLAQHLAEQGRLQGGVHAVKQALNKAVERKWGTQADSFNDSVGPGWIIDVSDYFQDELLYAIVRSEHGNRSVVAVVDEDEIGEFKKSGVWKTPEAGTAGTDELPIDVDVVAPATVSVPKVGPQPNDPRLIVCWEPLGQSFVETPTVKQTTFANAQAEVLQLLMKGCKVQVWENPKEPAITVSL
jgi:hypothetical protein